MLRSPTGTCNGPVFHNWPRAFPNWRSLAIEWQGYQQDPKILWLQDVTRCYTYVLLSVNQHFCTFLLGVSDRYTNTNNQWKGEILFFEKRGCNPLLSECDPCPSVLVSDLLNSSITRPISIKPIGSEMVNPQMLIMRTIHLFGNLVSWHFHVSLAEFLSWTPKSEFQATCKTCF